MNDFLITSKSSYFKMIFWLSAPICMRNTYGYWRIYHRVSRATGASFKYLYLGSIGSPRANESKDKCSWVRVIPKDAGSTGPRTKADIDGEQCEFYNLQLYWSIGNSTV